MISKERVKQAIAHQEPDRIPVAYNGAEEELAGKVHAHYQVQDEPALWLKLGIDFWAIQDGPYLIDSELPPSESQLQEVESVAEVEKFFKERKAEYDYQTLYNAQKELHTDKFRFIRGGSFFESAWHLRGFEKYLEDCYLNPEIIEAILQSLLEEMHERIENILKLFNSLPSEQNIDMVSFSDDMGTQEDLIFGPEIYCQFIKPRMKQLTEMVHSYGAVTSIHSCGAIRKMIPHLIEAGIDVLNPIQISAKNMDPAELKQEFGNDLVFWGAADTQTVFAHGEPDQVKAQVRELKTILGKDGGYICSPTHVVTKDIPLDNVIAFFEEAFEN